MKPTFEMIPGHYGASLGREMTRLGFFQSGFHVSLIGEPGRVACATDDRAAIERVSTAESQLSANSRSGDPLAAHGKSM
jgi:hypothetical protein